MIIKQKFFLSNTINPQCQSFAAKAGKNLYLPEDLADVIYINNLANFIKQRFKMLIVIGTGASSIIPKILFSLSTRSTLNVRYLEDLDSHKIDQTLGDIVPETTCFLVISKSGRTIEILKLFSICLDWMKAQIGSFASGHFYCITRQLSGNLLLKLVQDANITFIQHPNLPGRFSFFSCLGLLPAALAGFDIKAIKPSLDCFEEAASYFISMAEIYSNVVLMTYSSLFQGLALWFRQLISESLGKDGKGINPIIFEGCIDQHSQLQAYIDGLDDKFFILLVPTKELYENLIATSKLKLITTEHIELNLSQINSILNLLRRANKNIRVIEISAINEQFISTIVSCFMLETILYSNLKDINPFSQTAVDCMKNLGINESNLC